MNNAVNGESKNGEKENGYGEIAFILYLLLFYL
jgi:hypothetical protein